MQVIKFPDRKTWKELLKRPTLNNSSLETIVSTILRDVKQYGDAAVKKYSAQFDKLNLEKFEVSKEEFAIATKSVNRELKTAIQQAKSNITKFHEAQKEKVHVIETTKGVKCWRKSVAIEKVGLYIPGGSAPLFSTILMLGIPAKLAGCKEIILCTPPSPLSSRRGVGGEVDPAILYTAQMIGIKKVFKVGGVQAIGAMAFGTESISKVYKIFGPGNQYVTSAKQLVNKEGIAIDMPAGPSEVAVWADKTCVPAFVAADLLSQAEHGADSQVILISADEKVITEVQIEINLQVNALSRKETALKALNNSKAILVKNTKEAIDLINEYAPEHLIISCKNDEALAEKIINAGSVFLGNYSPESAGDYASGTNHTLPTNGYAKAYSGVSLDSFLKKITFQKLSKQGIKNIGKTVELMAAAEGLDAHKNAVTLRIK
ncbi:MAG TPA: histidinol dehydrogenase [Bacteroidia bacterium]|nr:histidinol dehydrogenase [Bacteroidia bacterium]